jgi:hypothetical protein
MRDERDPFMRDERDPFKQADPRCSPTATA